MNMLACREEECCGRNSTEAGVGSSAVSSFGDRNIPGAPHRTVQRFMGHSNVQTDIKEAAFMGGNDEMVAACSDDGHVFLYDAETGTPVRCAATSMLRLATSCN